MDSVQTTSTNAGSFRLPNWLAAALRTFIVLALPLVFILVNARLLMTEPYMVWQYNRAGFPEDRFGFTTEDRLEYGPVTLDYLFGPNDDLLAEQTFPDGTPLYNEREIRHMADVKAVTRQLSVFGYSLIALTIIAAVVLAADKEQRPSLLKVGMQGGVLTLIVIIAGLSAVALAFDQLFTLFHRLFFEGETWIFPTSDTLIRLFPEPFWIGAFALVFGGALLEGILLAGGSWLAHRKTRV